MTGADRPWHHREFRFLVSGRVVDMLGNAAAPIALAFAVLDLTGSTADLGLVVGARSLANVALVLFGGVLADRWGRSTVLVWSNVVSAATQGAVAMLVLTGQATIPRLIVLGIANGATAAASLPASSALVPQTVPAPLLVEANAVNRVGSHGATMAGAAVGGVVVAAVGPGWALAADAASFLLAGLLYAGVRAPAPRRTTTTTTWHDLREGWTAFTSQTWIWVVVAAFALVNAAWVGGVHVLGPAVADATFGRASWGVIVSASTAGMLLGGVVAFRLRPRRPMRIGMLCTVPYALLPLALASTPVVPVLIIAAVLGGACVEVFGVAWETTLQRNVPSDRLARVYAYDVLGSFVAIPLGQVAVGPLADLVGLRPVLLGVAAIIVLAALAALTSRSVRDVRGDPPATGEPPPAEVPTLAT